MANISIRELITRFDAGEFDSYDAKVQCDAGWYDWFCKSDSLRGKTYSMMGKVKQLAKSEMVNIDTMYVFFKNNCPMYGNLYDSFSICDLESGDVLFYIAPRFGHRGEHHGKPNVADFTNKNAIDATGKRIDRTDMYFDNWKEVRKYFGVL